MTTRAIRDASSLREDDASPLGEAAPAPSPAEPGAAASPVPISAGRAAQARRRQALPASVVHEAIRREGEEELSRPASALLWSGLAAGLSMGFSFVAEGLIRAYLPEAPWVPLVSKFGYSVGFLIVILGRQQLFTENTLTVILPLLTRRDVPTFLAVVRLWAVVLVANLAGAALFAWAIGNLGVFPDHVGATLVRLGQEAVSSPPPEILVRGVFAGWLIALMVWLLPAAESARVHVIVILTYVVGLGAFSHVIAGSVDTLYLVATGHLTTPAFLGGFLLPTLVGNILGGIALVAALNHAQVVAGSDGEGGNGEARTGSAGS